MSKLVDDFTHNDLLYGLTCDREVYLELLDKKLGMGGDYTIDRLTKGYSVEKGLKKGWTSEVLKQKAHPDEHLPAAAQEFFEFARKSRFAEKLQGIGTTNETKAGVRKGATLTKPFLRSKCKAGIDFAIARGFNIRFVTDSLDEASLNAIFKKEFEQPWYTGAELRYVHKNWERLQGKVVFYCSGESCDAPWIKFPGVVG